LVSRKAPEERAAAMVGYESAEAVYRSLRDQLTPETHRQLAVCFEWAREGIASRTPDEVSLALRAVHAASAYACYIMLYAAKERGG
jgi:hypothetical protein